MLNRELPEGGRLPERLRGWAERVADESPIYATLSAATADDEVALAIIGESPSSQPQPHLLFAAVQYLLLDGKGQGLATHYPAVAGAGARPHGDLVGLFRDFVRDHRVRLTELVATRRVQTNEVRRCTTLLPAFTAARPDDRPLALIEVGASAGLNLLFDRYRYDYGTVRTGPEDSPLTLDCQVRSGVPPVPDRMPQVAWRLGLDLHPIDVHDHDAVRWGRALIWPEQLDRVARFETAVEIARGDPPPMVKGDALELLPAAIAATPSDAAVLVYHSYVLNQWAPEDRSRLEELLVTQSRTRPIDRISVEMETRGVAYPAIIHTRYSSGEAIPRRLGTAHYHGVWLRWEA
ncbi:MAG: DUF2332 domain-containing protein [Acidimicrobiia bacterium]